MEVPQTEITIRNAAGEVLLQTTVAPGEYVLGRSPEAELFFEAELVSRQHARLTVNFDHLLIEDLGSANGTSVNGQPVTESVRLWPNQKVQLGTATIEFHRVKTMAPPDVSLAPSTATVQRLLPEELLRERKYKIGRVVAQGGMGAILDARDAAAQRSVAMKVMLDGSSPDNLTRFIAEARVTAQLEHPNIVPVHELSVDENGQPYYTMKMVRGITLKKVLELLTEGTAATVQKYPLPALLTIFQKVCDAVAFAHSHGVIHRDLKPENIMIGDFGEVLLMDWGLAKQLGGMRSIASPTPGDLPVEVGRAGARHSDFDEAAADSRTMAGTIMGTPAYMSPEQARGEVDELDTRSDLYALGSILFHLLYLQPPYRGRAAMQIVDKVQRGEIEWPTASKQAVPDSLLAVVRKAMALEKAQRYASVEDLQADILAYQNGFATSAEKAGLGKQLLLALKRHKIAAAGIAAVLLTGGVLGTKAIIEGRRAEREAIRANAALADLKANAPALLQLAESEADSQRFASALGKLDAALALDPGLLRARWQHAWVLLALERWGEAADALHLASEHDPANAKLASILPAVEKVAAATEAGRWQSDAAREVFAHLQTVEATGPALAFSGKLKLGAEERRKLVDRRLHDALGPGNYAQGIDNEGLVWAYPNGRLLRSFDAFRGLAIDSLNLGNAPVADLEPLRGLALRRLELGSTKVTDLTPLRGMPLQYLGVSGNSAMRDLSPLAGMKLSSLNCMTTKVADLTPLAGMPLTELVASWAPIGRIDALRGMPLVKVNLDNSQISDFSPLQGAPVETLQISSTRVSNLSFLNGMPLRFLHLVSTPVSDLAPLRGLPLEFLSLENTRITDISPLQGKPLKDLNLRGCKQLKDYTPILTLPQLERLVCDVLPAALLPLRESATLQSIEADAYPGEGSQGARPVAEFWRAYEAHQAAGKK